MAEPEHETSFDAERGDARLEGVIRCGTDPGVVICHPHPLHGGSMDSIVVRSLFEALGDAGYSVLRFNFRGIGASTGSYGAGAAEMRDTLGAFEHIKAVCGCRTVALAGYSFGAAVALKTIEHAQISWFAAVALPTEAGAELLTEAPIEVNVPSFVAAGDRDDISRVDNTARIARFSRHSETLVLPNCDHFFSNLESLKRLCDNIVRFAHEVRGREH